MKKYLFYIALTGWILGLVVHILSLVDIDVEEKIPFVWLLHIGIFVVWLPTILSLKNDEELRAYRQSTLTNKMNPIGSFKIIFRGVPTWMVIIAIAGFYYAVINFMLFIASEPGTPHIQDGQYILENHGNLIKTLTEQEYHHYKANVVRGFSGHWIAFYGIATVVLYKFSGLQKRL